MDSLIELGDLMSVPVDIVGKGSREALSKLKASEEVNNEEKGLMESWFKIFS